MRYKIFGTSPGIVYGEVLPWHHHISIPNQAESYDSATEEQRFKQAIDDVTTALQDLRMTSRIQSNPLLQDILDVHITILNDSHVIQQTIDAIYTNHSSAEVAYLNVLNEYILSLRQQNQSYAQDRILDIEDVWNRVVSVLNGIMLTKEIDTNKDYILLVDTVRASLFFHLDYAHIKGIISLIPTPTSHGSILAKSLGIPTVQGLTNVLDDWDHVTTALIDGSTGYVLVNPTKQEQDAYIYAHQYLQLTATEQDHFTNVPTQTKDGHHFPLQANISSQHEIDMVLHVGAEGVGLYRSEYLFLYRDTLPTEEEQYNAYRQVLTAIYPHPVVIRTLDIGGDKQLKNQPITSLRGIQYALHHIDVFKPQLRALLRAASEGHLSIMFPMVATKEQLKEAIDLVTQCRHELKAEGYVIPEDIPIGAMIETKEALQHITDIVRYVDFISIGTNDLTSELLDIRRNEQQQTQDWTPLHRTVLDAIIDIVDVANSHDVPVHICGEIASDPYAAVLLFGLGVTSLSMTASSIVSIRHLMSMIDYDNILKMANNIVQNECDRDILEEMIHQLEKELTV